MRLLEILMLQKDLNHSYDPKCSYSTCDGITVKVFTEKDRTFMSLFAPNDFYICSLERTDGTIIWDNFVTDPILLEIEESDLYEDECFLTLKYGKHFGKDVLDKITISIDRLEELVLNSIQKHNQGDNK